MPLDSPSRFQRILVIDDDSALLQALATVLEGAGFQVFTAKSGREATGKIREHPVELLITDLSMPDEDGIEIMRRLRKEHPQLKVIAMSGTFGPNMMSIAEKLGADATLSKPMTGTKLLECIRRLSEGKPDHGGG
jgi:DNA-binding NtrC family response regulator